MPPFPLPPSLPPTETLYYPTPTPASTTTTLLFLPGNPGLIEYYRPFLSALSALLPRTHVLGVSHAGFHPSQRGARDGASENGKAYWTLREQIEHKVQLVEWICRDGGRVVVVGHSVGAYIALEVIRVLSERRKPGGGVTGKGEGEGEGGREKEVVGGVMLFPTVVDIALSPQGRVLTTLLRLLPTLPSIASTLSTLLHPLPPRLLHLLILHLTQQPAAAAATTLSFLTTPGAVYQSLCLARDEMAEITADRWGAEIWGSEKAGGAGLVFWFAERDGWVGEVARRGVVGRGGGEAESWRPRVVVEGGVPHAFCLRFGEVVAGRVAAWVRGMEGVE